MLEQFVTLSWVMIDAPWEVLGVGATVQVIPIAHFWLLLRIFPLTIDAEVHTKCKCSSSCLVWVWWDAIEARDQRRNSNETGRAHFAIVIVKVAAETRRFKSRSGDISLKSWLNSEYEGCASQSSTVKLYFTNQGTPKTASRINCSFHVCTWLICFANFAVFDPHVHV